MILTKEVEVKPTGKMLKYYRDKGYDAKYKRPLFVNVNDLPDNSNIKIEVLCDYCKENVVYVRYADYTRRIKETDKIACLNCYPKKVKETSLLRYGVENYAQTKECRIKMENTMESRYGVKYAFQDEHFYNSYKDTCFERYGKDYRKNFAEKASNTFYQKTGYYNPLASPDIRKKIEETCVEKYGVKNPFGADEVKEKIKNSFIEKYGVENPNKLPEIRGKISKTLYKNSSQRSSTQQQYLCNLYNGILNYPISYYNADICFPDEKLCIEYDGGGHDLNVKLGSITQKEFNQKEIIRNNIIKRNGYKQMKIISSNDKLPSDDVLLKMLSDTRQYFTDHHNHSWIEFNIDNSIVRNAENKNGISYDFGSLRMITYDVA